MIDSLFFAGFDPLHDVPALCTVCSSRPPVFGFDYHARDAKGESQATKGFCCSACAAELLKKLENVESQEWASEEAALAQDDFDVSDLHKQRLAAFPGNGRK